MAESEVRKGDRCIETHQVMIYDRGGMKRLWQLVDVSEVKWTRALDGISTANLVIVGEACKAQADVLSRVEPRRHELVIFRNGERVWEGPIVQVAWYRDRATILAHDVLEYLKYTPLSRKWPNEDGGGPPLMLDRILQILPYELTTPYRMSVGTGSAVHNVIVERWETVDPPANIMPHLDIRPGTVLTRSVTEAFEMSLYEHIQNLARGGMDFTVIGRRIMFWDRAETIGRTRTLTDNDFYGEIEVFASGADHWSVEHVVAQPMQEEADAEAPPEEEVDPETLWELTRQNMFLDPRAVLLHPGAWGAGNGGHTLTQVTDEDGTTWARSTQTATGNGWEGLYLIVDGGIDNIDYRLRVTVRAKKAIPGMLIGIRGRVEIPDEYLPSNPIKHPIPKGESTIDVVMRFSSAISGRPGFVFIWGGEEGQDLKGYTLDVTRVIIERWNFTGGLFFDGDTPSDSVLRYSWEGTPHASYSRQEANTAGSDTALAVGNAGGPNPFYGVWTHITSTENEEGTAESSQEELNSQASRGLVGRTPVPVEIRVPSGGGIKPSHDLTIADLVPGVEVPVLATLNLRQISQMQRIEEVTITENSETEEVSVKMVPYGDVTGVVDGTL